MNRVLVAYSNTHPLMVAAAVDLIRKESQAAIDCVDLVRLAGQMDPREGVRDKLYEGIDRKFERFIKRNVNGEDITDQIRVGITIPPLPSNINELRNYSINESRLGLAALSSAASFARCSSNAIRDYGEPIRKAWVVAHKSYAVADQIKARYKYDRVYIFNGRHALSRPFSDHLEEVSKIIFYEYGSKVNKYELYQNRIHDAAYQAELINGHIADIETGTRFFEDKQNRWINTDLHEILAVQVPNVIPEELLATPYITFFSSSPDELFAISDSIGFGPFANQFELVLFAAKASTMIGRKLVLRLHPHLRVKHESWRQEWDFAALAKHGCLIISPESDVDSHALMRHSEAIITIGSSMGIDAAYLEIPNMVVGDAINDKIGCSFLMHSVADLETFIAHPTPLEGAKLAAIRYGSYVQTFGIEMACLELTDLGDEKIDGEFVSPTSVLRKRIKRALSLRVR